MCAIYLRYLTADKSIIAMGGRKIYLYIRNCAGSSPGRPFRARCAGFLSSPDYAPARNHWKSVHVHVPSDSTRKRKMFPLPSWQGRTNIYCVKNLFFLSHLGLVRSTLYGAKSFGHAPIMILSVGGWQRNASEYNFCRGETQTTILTYLTLR